MSERIYDEIDGGDHVEGDGAIPRESLSVGAASDKSPVESFSKIENAAGRRFPEHPLSGLLRANVERFKHWINEKAPEDLY